MDLYRFTVTSANGYESIVARELEALGISKYRIGKGNVTFTGTQKEGLKVCLWSRVASKVLLTLFEADVYREDDIYRMAADFDWSSVFDVSRTFAVDSALVTGSFRNGSYTSLVLKDGIADNFRKNTGRRPFVETDSPDIRINLFIERNHATVSLDMTGNSLHRRGYRIAHVEAPLKENAAAALLYRGGWEGVSADGGSFIDPMCGSGTLVIEAAMMAAKIPPALERSYFCFKYWKKFDRALWESLRKEADAVISENIDKVPPLFGYDCNTDAVHAARKNVSKAFSFYPELLDKITIAKKDIHKLSVPEAAAGKPGLIGVNPPYGERLGAWDDVLKLYADMGAVFKERFEGWKGIFITGDEELARKTGLKASRINKLYNGPIECISAVFSINSAYREEYTHQLSQSAQMFANRIVKNLRLIGKPARKNGITCYRLYDADLPDYSAAIDIYEDKWIYLQEYAAPAYIDPQKTKRRVKEMERVLREQFPDREIFIRRREKQKGSAQYMKEGETGSFHTVQENGLQLWVNFNDYLDTGIFLDHRLVRKLIKESCSGKSMLNLFSYTCTASVHAAAGGATETTSVDTSATYLEWGKRNFILNGFNPEKHSFVREDCIEFLKKSRKKYDFIFIDPPTFSNSKSREDIFDVQRDHRILLLLAENSLKDDGTILFSNNYRKFRLDEDLSDRFDIKDITRKSIPADFGRNRNIHKCWIIRKKI